MKYRMKMETFNIPPHGNCPGGKTTLYHVVELNEQTFELATCQDPDSADLIVHALNAYVK